ncbi:hypothetical protein BOTCAL_0302g00060 [Botryotinia calthae]|uniref:Uncharacterized protein n=1 Tax=Botryotinia calthae TaxID=38488 RepID=A0A4Y8CX18_9HELO|nr:hypothetical protein BOTCAL_0302g00060 [Botryotinia calthae]
MPGNSTVERWLGNIGSNDGQSTVRGGDNQRSYASRKDESVDSSFGKPPQASSRRRAKPHEHQKSSQKSLPPQRERFEGRSSSDSRSRVKPRKNNQDPRWSQWLPVSDNSSHNTYSETASQSNLPRSYSPSGHGRYTSYSIPSLGFRSPEVAPVSHITITPVTELQRPSAGVASHQGISDIPTTYHTVQRFPSSPNQGRHRDAYSTINGSFKYTVPQETQTIGFRTAEGKDAYERYLREAGHIERMVSHATSARETWARDIWESEMGKQGGSGGMRDMYQG